MSAVAPGMISWHITRTETLSFHFGFHEKKPLSFEHTTTHRNSLKRLDQHFTSLRQLGDAFDQPVKPAKQEHKYNLADELTSGGGKGAVVDDSMYEKDLKDQAPTQPAHESYIPSAKTFGAENATYDRIDEPVTVAAVSESILAPHAHAAEKEAAHEEALPPPKDDILNLPAKDETVDLARGEALVVNEAGVPVTMPVAQPVEVHVQQAVKEAQHPELLDDEEREEEERAAAQGAFASGSAAALEAALLHKALETTRPAEEDTSVVQMPVAEPVVMVSASTLHAPHPSLDGSEPIAETLAGEALVADSSSLDALRQQHEDEAAAARAETERLESSSLSQAERETAELELMSRTKRLAALHERIIRQQTIDAQGPDLVAIKKSPALAPTAQSSRIMEIQQLHLTQQAESALTHTAAEKSAAGPPVRGSRTKELAAVHEQKIKEESDAKKQQDDVFAGKAKVPTAAAGTSTASSGSSSSSSSPRGGRGGKRGNNKKR